MDHSEGAMAVLPKLLYGLIVLAVSIDVFAATQHTITSGGHSITVWGKSSFTPWARIVLIHGRTWSSLWDFDCQVEAGAFPD